MSKRIILASQSSRRKQLLDQLGLKYEIQISNVDEVLPDIIGEDTSAEQLATEIARQKAFAIGEELRKQGANGQLAILAADTIVVLDNKVFGKPTTTEEAKSMLRELCGKIHQVYTGVALLFFDFGQSTMQCLTECENSRVNFRHYSDAEIDAYVATGEPMDKAGAYAVQGIGSFLVDKIEGCYTNIVGLPVPRVIKMLRAVGIEVLGQ